MKKSHLTGTLCAVAFGLVTLSSHAALIGVLPETPGGSDWQAYYDDVANLTWLANANAAVGSVYDQGDTVDPPAPGVMTWDNANNWATNLDINGVTGWRLPSMDVNGDTTVVDCSSVTQAVCMADNEYGYLYHHGAGGSGITAASPGPFSNVKDKYYWSGTDYAPGTTGAWVFSFGNGSDTGLGKEAFSLYAWAVHDGNAGEVPAGGLVFMDGFE